ncbi:MAG: hypothetical protein GY862_12320, partial [Gammaproteobacteria bacterium]|nr:hypothetical protein [Gammaproteobacteria bacterium]
MKTFLKNVPVPKWVMVELLAILSLGRILPVAELTVSKAGENIMSTRNHLFYIMFGIVLSTLAVIHTPVFAAEMFTEAANTYGVADNENDLSMVWLDFDNDNDLDVLILPAWQKTLDHDVVLYRNDGNAFTNISDTTGLTGYNLSNHISIGDYDNDGDIDLLLGAKLFRNDFNQSGTFTLIGTYGHTFVDYDNDGYLDIFSKGWGSAGRLYKNNGGGFTEIAGALGLNANSGHTRSLNLADYDGDGDMDILIVNGRYERPALFRNDVNTNGLFTDSTDAMGLSGAGGIGYTESGIWGDYDNDGDLDLYIVNSGLYRNDGNVFTNVTAALNVTMTGVHGFHANWGDYDNDGDLDLYVAVEALHPNRLYRNEIREGNGFVETGEMADEMQRDYGGSWGDFDKDGDLDYFLVGGYHYDDPAVNRLYQNNAAENGNHWLHLNLAGTISNRSAIGATIRIAAGGQEQTRHIASYGAGSSQNTFPVVLGLGAESTIDTLTIHWPSGIEQVFNNVAADQVLTVTETVIVTNVSSTAPDGVYGISQTIPVTVTFNVPVNVTGMPQMILETGDPDATANYSSGSGTDTLIFNYDVASGHHSTDLKYTGPAALILNGGAIADASAHDAILSLPDPGAPGSLGANKALVVDGMAPAVINVFSSNANGIYGSGQTITINVKFSETVNVSSGIPRLNLETGAADAAADYSGGSGSGSDTLIFNYTAAAGHASADLDYVSTEALALNGATIQDTMGNDADLTLAAPGSAGSLAANKNIEIDTSLVINEVDYDQGGTDTGEFIEIKNISSGTVDLGAYAVQLIDNAGASDYQTIGLNGDLAAGDYYVICTDNTKVLHCDQDVSPDTDFIRDGTPNAVSLIKGVSVLDALSYEGNTPNGYTETSGAPADNGDTTLTGLSRYPDGTDSNDNANDFSLRCVTPGGANKIADNEACFELSIDDKSVIEGDSGTVSTAFTISLSHAATSAVTANVATADSTAAAGSDYAALVSMPITFLANDNTAQTIDVMINGDEIDENAGETFYVQLNDISANAVIANNQQGAGTITDDDAAGIAVYPAADLMTSESGAQAVFTVILKSEPVADVDIALSSSDTSEGTVSSAVLTFTSDDWNTAQTVTITGIDDSPSAVDGDIAYAIVTAAAASDDDNYNGLNPEDISVANSDNDVSGITISPVSGLITTEAGGKATFTVTLNTRPSAGVTLSLRSSEPGEGTVSPASLTFSADNWNVAQPVTVTGVDDSPPAADGDIAYTVITAAAVSEDDDYNELNPDDVLVANKDNDIPGFSISPVSGLITTESGDKATFTVKLNTRPSADITLPLNSSEPGEGTVSPASLTFTADNWNVAQTVTVTGIDDSPPVADGNIAYTVVTAAAVSVDDNYSGLNPDDISVINNDNDVPGFAISPVSGLITTESGDKATFTVKLNTRPSADISLPLSSSEPGEGT